MKLVTAILAVVAFCLLLLATDAGAASCTPDQTGPVSRPNANSKARQYINILGGLKKKASANLRKIDQAFWPDLGIQMDQTAKSLIQRVKPLTRKRSASGEQVEVVIKGTVSGKLLRYVQAWGTVLLSSPKYQTVHALLPPNRLQTISTFEGVVYIGVPGEARTNQASNFPGVISHRADLAQLAGVTGKGVKVGVLSDSVDLIGIAQSAGQLPNVTIIRGGQGWGVSEGVALLEVVHQVAPDAELYFATAFGSDAAYAHNILALAGAGCKVIVDNVFYFQEPVFEDGIIAQAVNEVVANGVIYITAAGNQGNTFFHTSSTWEGDYAPTNWTTFTDASFSPFYQDVHLFTPTDSFNKISGSPRFITLHWSDPFFNAYADYDLFVFDGSGNLVSFSTTSALAFEIAPTYFLPSGDYFIVVARYFGPERFLSIRAYDGILSQTTNGFIFGHAATTGALAIGAIQQVAPDNFLNRKQVAGYLVPEPFTADGPRRIFYENGANVTPDVSSTGGLLRQKPDFIAADGVTTVTPGFTIYYGTSASAAHAAGIAALAVSVNPSLTPQQFRVAAIATAVDALTPGFDEVTGYGALDAENLIAGLSP